MTTAIANKPDISNLAVAGIPTNGSVPGSVTRKQRRVVYTLVAALGFYLLARYTRLLMLFGIDVVHMAGGISISILWPAVLIGSFLAVGLFAARAHRMDQILVSIQNRRKFASVMTAVAVTTVIVLAIGKLTYSNYSDEWRDFLVANMVAEHGLDLYLNGTHLDLVEPRHVKWLKWAQRLHPPGQYLPAALLPDGTYSLHFYRFLFMMPLALFFGGTLWLARRSGSALRLYAVMLVLLLGLTYLRNYSFVRFANELVPFIAFSCVLIVVYSAYVSKERIGLGTVGLIFLFYTIGLYTKATLLVPMMSLIGTLFVGSVLMREMRLARLAAICIGVSIASLGLYAMIFQGTEMFAMQQRVYGDALDFLSGYVTPDKPVEDYTVAVQVAHTRGFLRSMPFQYGPLCVGAFLYTVWCFVTKRVPFTKLDFLLILFVAAGVVGIGFMMFLRTQYTASLMLPLMFLFARVIVKTVPVQLLMRLLLVAAAFALCEVLLYGAP